MNVCVVGAETESWKSCGSYFPALSGSKETWVLAQGRGFQASSTMCVLNSETHPEEDKYDL